MTRIERVAPTLRDPDEKILIDEASLLLAEKRTSLSTVRTGVALVALPRSVVSALVATSRMYDRAEMAPVLVPVLAVCGVLLVLGAYLIARAVVRIHRYDAQLHALRRRNRRLARLLAD